jgi:hypothetical protein
VSRYLTLAEEGLAQKLECPMDQGLLSCNQTNEDEIYLYCLSCDYKKTIGLGFYQDLLRVVDIQNRRIPRDGSIDYEVNPWQKNL